MTCNVTKIGMPWMLVAANSTTERFLPASGWVDVAGVTGARGWGEMRGRNGNVTAVPAVQLTNDVHDPGSDVTAVGATISADGVSDPNGVTTLSTGAFRFARVGWLVVLSSGSTLATASVGGVVELVQS